MILDLVVLVALVWGFFVGFRRGILHSLFFLLGLIVGTLLALKLSQVTTSYLHQWIHLDHSYLPLISFAILFFLGLGATLLIASGIESFLKALKLNLLNKLAGAFVWMAIFLFLTSTAFWYLRQYEIISDELVNQSVSYDLIAPLAPWLVHQVGILIPWMKDLFNSIVPMIRDTKAPVPNYPTV